MSLEDLDSILNKEAVIYTYSAAHLSQRPEEAETIYKTYALTHIPLGDTTKYLEIIFNWIGGRNKGAFVGAVSGDYGHGKTSFMLHIWDASTTRKIFAVPPFSWEKVTDMIDGVAAWIKYILGKTHPELASKAWKIYETHKEHTLQELAEKVATETGRDVDDVIRMLKTAEQKGGIIDTQPSVDRFLDYCEAVTGILKEAGYIGLLVLLDEPEVAAKKIGTNKVAGILFDIANGVPSRYGDYGVFISMPNNFLAQVQASFASLPARLETRQCFPRLGDLYGDDFAKNLWSRYMEAFGLTAVSNEIILPVTLTAIGQVASSTRNDLSYGPRTVVSAFRRIVHCYKQNHRPHTPVDFVRDCIEGEILVSNYAARVRESIGSPETEGIDKTLLLDIAAFPNGLPLETAGKLGIAQDALAELLRRPGLVYKHGNVIGLRGLQKTADIATTDQLKETIADIFGEFSITPETLGTALSAFMNSVMPRLFEKRQGQQLLGWDILGTWRYIIRPTTFSTCLVGAFRQTVNEFPMRTVVVAVGPLEEDADKVISEIRSTYDDPDIIVHFQIRWRRDSELPTRLIEVDAGNPAEHTPGIIRLVLDFAEGRIDNSYLEDVADNELFFTPLGLLFLIEGKAKRKLSREYEAQWQTEEEKILRELLACLLGNHTLRGQASEQINQSITGDAFSVVGVISKFVLNRRYPDYSTLIQQPHWEKLLNSYMAVLKNQDIPLSCKRGREPWIESGERVAKAFNTSLMNLTGGYFAGYENLISIKSQGKAQPVQIDFKLHPLEELIMSEITNDNPRPKRKFEGVDCWQVPWSDLEDMIVYSGYSVEELKHIVAIGQSRGSFSLGEIRGENVLYCKPLDLDQMKAQLKEKLSDLQREIDEFKKLPNFKSTLDTAVIGREIDKITDLEGFESLTRKMNREFELMHSRLPNYFELFQDDVGRIQKSAAQIQNTLKDSREVASLQSAPKGLSRWCSDLSTYIIPNLKNQVKAQNENCDSLVNEATKLSKECIFNQPGKAVEKVAHLLSGWLLITTLKQKLENIQSETAVSLNQIRAYGEWRSLLTKSDDVYQNLTSLKNEPSHVAKANELLNKLEEIWGDITTYLKVHNVQGLASYRQFQALLEKLDEDRKKYLQELRSAFEEKKTGVNNLLQTIELGQDYRCKEVFNPDDIQGSYDRLYTEATKQVLDAIKVELKDVEEQCHELRYAVDILSQVQADKAKPLLEDLDKNTEQLKGIVESVTAIWIANIVAGEVKQQIEIKGSLRMAREVARNARRELAATKHPGDEGLSQTSKDMLRLIATGSGMNLKQVILNMMSGGHSSKDVLGVSLECLAELFKNGKIQIIVEKASKQ